MRASNEFNIFRREALEHRIHSLNKGSLLYCRPRWTNYVFWSLSVFIVAAVGCMTFVRVNETVRGPSVVENIENEHRQRIIARFPRQFERFFHKGSPMWLEIANSRYELTIASIDENVPELGKVSRSLGNEREYDMAIFVTAYAPSSVVMEEGRASCSIHIRAERIIEMLFPGLSSSSEMNDG